MSVKKTVSLSKGEEGGERDVAKKPKTKSYDRCLSFMEISTENAKSLKHLDSGKLKEGIKRWAKAVVAYARQVSGRLGSGRFGSSRKADEAAAMVNREDV